MFDMQVIREILLTVGLTGLVVIIVVYAGLLIVRAWTERTNSNTRGQNATIEKDEIVNSFAVKFNDDIKELRAKYESVLEKFHATDKELAREQGRRETIQELMETERRERNELKEEIQKQNIRILELEKHQQQSKQRIGELEAEIELLNKQLAQANGEISLLQAQKRELESLLEKERNRASSLNDLVTKYREEAEASLPDEPNVDDTIVPVVTSEIKEG